MLSTIKSKFILALLGTLIPSILLCLFLLNSLHTSKNNVGTLYNRDFTGSALASSIDGQLTRVDINILRMIAIGTPELITQWKQENQTRFTQVAASIVELKQLLSQEAEHTAQLQKITASYALMQAGMQRQIELIEAGDIAGGAEVNRTQVKDNANATFAGLATLRDELAASAKLRYQQQQATNTRAITLSAIALGLIALAGVSIAMLLGNAISRSIQRAVAAVEQLSRGVLDVDVHPILSSAPVWSPIPYPEEIGREEALYRGTDHWLPARSRSGHSDQGPMPAPWLQRGLVLPVAQQVRRDERARCQAAQGP
ncbi:hypothetical protein NCPPB1935_17355 [Xanthomonas campestris pv. nigromaculans]|nr:hypothetical protein NCPPB1935_17355 [Xanthomonas campestris pv. nigromaculans]